ncbi:MAG: hypothetical protein OER92_00375 [Alphaproteobacteria bacterium]|nr:hypothetical protein [Alphaproteobacteria bacterium]
MYHRPISIFKKNAFKAALGCAVFALALDFPQPAFAYLDPGTGSIILQLLLGGVAGGLVVFKLYWHKFKGIFVGNAGDDDFRADDSSPRD